MIIYLSLNKSVLKTRNMGRISLDLDENTHAQLRKRIAEDTKKLKEQDKNNHAINQRTFIEDLIKKELEIK